MSEKTIQLTVEALSAGFLPRISAFKPSKGTLHREQGPSDREREVRAMARAKATRMRAGEHLKHVHFNDAGFPRSNGRKVFR